MQCLRHHSPRRVAFTLAEVLITLAIIGVVAAMTLPTLIARHQEKLTVTKLKKAYSIINQAYLRALNDNGPLDSWGLENSEFEEDPETGEEILGDQAKNNGALFFSKLMPYFSTLRNCLDNEEKMCETYDRYSLNGTKRKTPSYSRLILSDGSILSGGWISNINCGKNMSCGDFSVDINGSAPPNMIGRDIFYFWIYRDRIKPLGLADEVLGYTFNNKCSRNQSTEDNGYGCTAWVIYNENMDYLHCDDLSWDGKKKCK